ncbi:hypothetical protein BT93_J0326 [Corymbia citriodora subsp. variegata]|nr:hypothetical protein BT93_J0326 [Corymbia citriodora subsp. variegata]
MEKVEDKDKTERTEEGEFIPAKSPDASVKNSINAHDVTWRGQSPFDWSHSKCSMFSRCVPIVKDKGSKRESLNRSDMERASPSFSELGNVNVARKDRHDLARERVIATLRLYRDICHELEQEKSKGRKESTCISRIDFHAAKEVKRRAEYAHGARQIIGDVPGVEVGDKFYYRMELAIVGLHRPPQSGIDYMGPHRDILATSVLVYLGQGGGMPSCDKNAEDKKLTRGNFAVVNGMKRNRPVRVIRKDWEDNFTYDGLYVVDRFRKISRANGKMVFEFIMKRLPGQPEILQKKKMKVLESSG